MKNLLSIVIPTKNRYEQLETSLSFLLNTDYIKSTHIIIFDNSDLDYQMLKESKKIFSRITNFSGKLNLEIIQENNLTMTENWEKALDYSIEFFEYSMLIEDKQILKKNTLAKIFELIKKSKPEIILYKTSSIVNQGSNYLLVDNSKFNEDNMPAFYQKKYAHFEYYNKVAVDLFFKSKNYFEMMFLPRCLNTVIKNVLLSNLKNNSLPRGKILKSFPYPDFALSFNLYKLNPKIFFLNECLSVFFAKKISTHTLSKSYGLKSFLSNSEYKFFYVIFDYCNEDIILKNIYNLPYLITLMQFQYFQKSNGLKIIKPSFLWLKNDIMNTISGGGSSLKIFYSLWFGGVNKSSYQFKLFFLKIMILILLKSSLLKIKFFFKYKFNIQKKNTNYSNDENSLINIFFNQK